MATRTAAPRRTTDKRRSILDAAAPVFAEAGYERASIEAIAAAAGVSKPTIYSYFGGKEQLFRESLADSARALNAESLTAIQQLDLSTTGWRDSLYRVALQLSSCLRSERASGLNRLVNAEIGRDPEVFRTVRAAGAEPLVQALAGRLAMLGNAGLLELPDPVRAARQFIALIHAELIDLTVLGTRPVADDVVRAAVDAGVDTFLAAHRRR